ncbi:alpha/beta-hydrolase [Coniochaeta ligniaria NRRL 30616]|uniref:Carboxypeptidase n=1 Tax=Coniochaeta ligniaria NRRL 30616 TaxID=1408157 RepID=A0A1J7J166_9PEZI|nr:alpha/beta-hydrolase [Coniochaeta ligniaria NRRL 30616]
MVMLIKPLLIANLLAATRLCETTPGVKSYSGYVNLPANPSEGRLYDIHTFFWFFEARKDPANAPLSLWLQGGPGSPSTPAALGETGPCFVTPDSKATVLNPWSWNNEVNMLYMDQPVQTGFSYDTLINGTVDETLRPYIVTPLSPSGPVPELNSTTLLGVFPSQSPLSTANTTSTAALAAWQFMQIWMKEFPVYKPKDNRFSIWAESYGGHYGPTFADFFASQSRSITKRGTENAAIPLTLDTVGIVNGCIDILTQMPLYPKMAYNNTYGVQVINETEYNAAVNSFPTCRKMVESCRSLADAQDPLATGTIAVVNKACGDAYSWCFQNVAAPLEARRRNQFDITATVPGDFPPRYAAGFLNSKEVQLELGVPLNFSGLSVAAATAFVKTGDFVRGRNLAILGELLDGGVKVALVYGDRDYQCNWYGGEQISLAIESEISEGFRTAGYAEIHTNETYVGGYVRQYGNLSFSRVLDAGHETPWYQPETAYQIFKRVMFNNDVATGKIRTSNPKGCAAYSTTGLGSVADIRNDLPSHPPSQCYTWDQFETCTDTQIAMLRDGTAITKDYVMIGYHTANGTVYY